MHTFAVRWVENRNRGLIWRGHGTQQRRNQTPTGSRELCDPEPMVGDGTSCQPAFLGFCPPNRNFVYCTISNGSTSRVTRDTRISSDIFDQTAGDRDIRPQFNQKLPKLGRATARRPRKILAPGGWFRPASWVTRDRRPNFAQIGGLLCVTGRTIRNGTVPKWPQFAQIRTHEKFGISAQHAPNSHHFSDTSVSCIALSGGPMVFNESLRTLSLVESAAKGGKPAN